MTDSNSNPVPATPSQSTSKRRSSFTGQTLADLFSRSGSMSASNPNQPGPITAAAAQAQQQRRRLSLSTAGLPGGQSGSPPQTSPFSSSNGRSRSDSTSSCSVDESPFEEADSVSSSHSTPLARRMSFGARALRDVRHGGSAATSSGEGFNYAENMRTRAERMSASSPSAPSMAHHHRAKSVSSPGAPFTPKALPKAQKPDAFQERMLKGDFIMD